MKPLLKRTPPKRPKPRRKTTRLPTPRSTPRSKPNQPKRRKMMTQTNAKSLNEQIMALREKTGAGMMDCKKALTEAHGDFDKAVESLRKKGLADAAKK